MEGGLVRLVQANADGVGVCIAVVVALVLLGLVVYYEHWSQARNERRFAETLLKRAALDKSLRS